jgi:glutamyl-tRNA synthetase
VGGLRTALYNWLFARQQKGVFILRIEDTDQSRIKEGALENLLETLNWAGLDIDEGPGAGGDAGPYMQSERLEIYHKYVGQLVDDGSAYRCFCTPERIDELRERQRKMGVASRYDRNCRHVSKDESETRAEKEAHVIRLAIPDSGRIVFEDIVRKKVAFDFNTVDEQVLIKSDGFPTYHLANVVDDHLMGVTHVIRGEEWLPSMPKHLLLYQAFGWEEPKFAHLPLLLNRDRSKLSKRQGHVAVDDYQREGYLPQALVNFVALLGWRDQSDQEVYSIDELIEAFSLERVQKGGAIFDVEKLLWLNGQHYMRLNPADFHQQVLAYRISSNQPEWDITPAISASLQPRIRTFAEIEDLVRPLFSEDLEYSQKAEEALTGAEAAGILSTLLAKLEETSDFTGEWFLSTVKSIGADFAIKGRELWHPIRAAIDGKVEGIDMVTIVDTLGPDKCRERIKSALTTF